MAALTPLKVNSLAWWVMPFVYPLCLLVTGLIFLSNYLQDSTTVLLAGAAAVAATAKKHPGKKATRFGIAALLLITLTWFVPVNTLLYFAFAFVLFFWLATKQVTIHYLGIIALFISSPVFQYATGAFSFPIRLQLTKVIGGVFSLFTSNIALNGNTILYQGREFAVDPACMGLHMLSISLLLGILLWGLLQQKAGKTVNWRLTVAYLVSLVILNLLANVVRIILLVQFAVPPEAFMHDLVGLLCLLLYVCLPACLVARTFVSKSAKAIDASDPLPQNNAFLIHVLLFTALLITAQKVATTDTYESFKKSYSQPVSGYRTLVYAPGILKLESPAALIYVKFIRGFYDTEHNPSVCWRGSGYVFKEVKEQQLGGLHVYTALLCKGEEKLFTAWWYGNSREATTSQWEWRWHLLKTNANYAVVNVTASTKTDLIREIEKIATKETLAPLFKIEN